MTVTDDVLRTELMAVRGIATADVDVVDGVPAGVQVQLAPGADSRRVGVEVQRILAAHGMRTRFTSGGEAPRSVESSPPSVAPPVVAPTPPATPPPSPPGLDSAGVVDEAAIDDGTTQAVGASDESSLPVRAVALEESADGVMATVSLADGSQASRRVDPDTGDVDEAVAGATADAAGRHIEVLGVEWAEIGGSTVVTVVVRTEDASTGVGAAAASVGRSYAVAVATRAALQTAPLQS